MYLKLLFIIFLFSFSSCKQLYGPAFDGQASAPIILSFNLEQGKNSILSSTRSVTGKINHDAGIIVLDAPLKQSDLESTSLIPTITTSESGVKISINGTVVESGVTAVNMAADSNVTLEKDGYKRDYKVHVRRWRNLISPISSNIGYPAFITESQGNYYFGYKVDTFTSEHQFKTYILPLGSSNPIVKDINTPYILTDLKVIGENVYILTKDADNYMYFYQSLGLTDGGASEWGGLSSLVQDNMTGLAVNNNSSYPVSIFRLDSPNFNLYSYNGASWVSKAISNESVQYAVSDESFVLLMNDSNQLFMVDDIFSASPTVKDIGVTGDIFALRPDISVQSENNIYIVYGEGTTSVSLKVIQWNGSSAVFLDTSSITGADYFKIASNAAQSYPVLGIITGTDLTVYWFNGSSWVSYGGFSNVSVASDTIKWLALDAQGRILLSTYSGGAIQIYRYE